MQFPFRNKRPMTLYSKKNESSDNSIMSDSCVLVNGLFPAVKEHLSDVGFSIFTGSKFFAELEL